MNYTKKFPILLAFLLIAVLDILIYWNYQIYYKAEKVDDDGKKIKILKKAIDFYPSNELIHYELGRAYFNLSVNSISDFKQSKELLQEAIASYYQALRSNPANYFSHFNLGQSLLYMSYLMPSPDIHFHEEFKKAVHLSGRNYQIFYEVAKIYFSRWPQISDIDRSFIYDILKKVMETKNEERIRSLLYIWEMNVKDYKLMEEIMPEDDRVLEMYADFLGEKSLSLEKRHKNLAKSEFLKFKKAKEEYKEGEKEFFSFRMEEAIKHFKNSLNILRNIKFYQKLIAENFIDISEYNKLRKSLLLYMAKCFIEQGEGLKEVKSYLVDYLTLEEDLDSLNDLEAYLEDKSLIVENPEESFNDLDRLAFELFLYFKKNRYAEIMEIGRVLRQSFVVIPKEKEKEYVKVLNLIGDSFQKSDYIYDSNEFYQKVLEVDPENLETLVHMRKNFERLGADEKILEIDEKIEKIISSKKIKFKDLTIAKAKSYLLSFFLVDRRATIDLQFDSAGDGAIPLISVFFDDHVVWDDYLREGSLSVTVESKLGKNSIRVIPINKSVSLIKLLFR